MKKIMLASVELELFQSHLLTQAGPGLPDGLKYPHHGVPCDTCEVRHRDQKLQPAVLKCHPSPAEDLALVIG